MFCRYCGIEPKVNHAGVLEEANCNFCGGSLVDEDTGHPKLCIIQGDRFEFHEMKHNVFIEHVEQPVGVLKTYHTFDLYLLLKEVRSMRSTTYYGMRVLNNASEVDDDFKGLAQDQGKNYEYWTRRKFVIENILLERQGYFPERITDKVLGFMADQIKKSMKQKMKISQTKQAIK
ncbi:hypothetical protein [Bacillus cereus]|uniref:hypothetical protein n=1 Tax=Bacillus cereus group TaxID=86661 RepID=UPI002405905C|nr:hypothetical protein [Bacillus cereus]MDF9530576.1 hypothetical protein [Bacillus cereus]MDG1578850.1 hypothetical protein [Bacillus cereus]